jgi:hypothetical protein
MSKSNVLRKMQCTCMNVSNCLLYYDVIKVKSWSSNNKKILKDEVCKTGNGLREESDFSRQCQCMILGEDNHTPTIFHQFSAMLLSSPRCALSFSYWA